MPINFPNNDVLVTFKRCYCRKDHALQHDHEMSMKCVNDKK